MKNEITKVEKETRKGEEMLIVMPLVDIIDCNDGVVMQFEVPGANSGSVDVEVRNSVMNISAASSLRRGGRPVMFKRSFQLSDGANIEKIAARTQDGVLTLTIPKSERAKVHKVKVE